MEYTINKLAGTSGVSTRTLRYYDQIGLLCPARFSSNGYRIYSQNEVDLLQQILFYRELGVPLEEIGRILNAPDYDKDKALEGHLSALMQKKGQIELLIDNVIKTISSQKGETTMNNAEKFEGFKQKLINDNETVYGKEIREKYGNHSIDASNGRVKGMSKERWEQSQTLSASINDILKEALEQGDPASESAQKACDLHRQWLCLFWEDGTYSKETHLEIARMYCDDDRFKKYYEAIAPGATGFLLCAMKIYCTS